LPPLSFSILSSIGLHTWRYRQYVPSKRRKTPTILHGVTSQTIKLFINTAVRISNRRHFFSLFYIHVHSRSGRCRDLSLLHSIQTYSGAHPASNPMGPWDSCPGVKRPERDVRNGGDSSWRGT
jgi:hypothetical protein